MVDLFTSIDPSVETFVASLLVVISFIAGRFVRPKNTL